MSELPKLSIDFTEQPPIPAGGLARANELMASGSLFRYGEAGAEELDVAELEREFAAMLGTNYCVAMNSCGASLAVALKAAGVVAGDDVLMNAFTLAPVPGSVAHVGANAVLVDVDEDYRIDLESLKAAHARTNARWLLLSYMRGHVPDMTAVMELCDELDITVIEDCAHTMGASWSGQPTGTFGSVACFSTQTFKHINSGEGGLLVTNDEDIAARAILLSGSYMLYEQHGAAPGQDVFERHRLLMPNWSMRMSALAGALVRSQLELLEDRAQRWRHLYDQTAQGLRNHDHIRLPDRPAGETAAPSSLQFTLVGLATHEIEATVAACKLHGVFLKWFGNPSPVGFTSQFDHWRYVDEQALPKTKAVLAGLCDLRLPLGLSDGDCVQISQVVVGAVDRVVASR